MIHSSCALLHTVLLRQILQLLQRDRRWITVPAAIAVRGLVDDNLIAAVRHLIGAGDLLMNLSCPQSLVHAQPRPLPGMIGLTVSRTILTDWTCRRRGTRSLRIVSPAELGWAPSADRFGRELVVTIDLSLMCSVEGGTGGPPPASITAGTLLMFSGSSM